MFAALISALIGVFYILVSIYAIIQFGFGYPIPIFCLPLYGCYPGLPLSMIVFSSFLILIAFETNWDWQAIPLVAFTSLMFDVIGSLGHWETQVWPYDIVPLIWLIAPFLFVWLFHPKVTTSKYLLLYLLFQLAIVNYYAWPSFMVIPLEPTQEIIFCAVVYLTLKPKTKTPG